MDSQKQTSTQTSTWPPNSQGWFIYHNKKVSGPYITEEAFCKSSKFRHEKDVFISQPGFSQWYPLKEYCKLYDQIQNPVVNQEVKKLQTLVTKGVYTLNPHQPKNQISEHDQKEAKNTSDHQQAVTTEKPVQPPTTPPSFTKSFVSENFPNESSIQKRFNMRLGQYRSPSYESALWFFSMGIGTFFWYLETTQELTNHLEKAENKHKDLDHDSFDEGIIDSFSTSKKNVQKMLLAALSIIPFLSVFAFEKLSKKVIAMETQNRYSLTSIRTSRITALFPPFYLFYIQKKINTHWKLHDAQAQNK